jgi:hypothetical protein
LLNVVTVVTLPVAGSTKTLVVLEVQHAFCPSTPQSWHVPTSPEHEHDFFEPSGQSAFESTVHPPRGKSEPPKQPWTGAGIVSGDPAHQIGVNRWKVSPVESSLAFPTKSYRPFEGSSGRRAIVPGEYEDTISQSATMYISRIR